MYRIRELEEFDIETIQERFDPKTKVLTVKIQNKGTVLRFTISIDIIDYQWCNFYIEGSQNKK